MISSGSLNLVKRNYLSMKQTLGVSLLWLYSEPFIMFLILGYGVGSMIESVNGGSYFKFIAPGFIVATLMHVAFNEVGLGFFSKLLEKKKIRSLSLVPISKREILLGEIFWGTIKGVASTLVLIVFSLYIGLIPISMTFWFLIFLIFCGLVFSSLGMMVCSLSQSQNTFILFQALIIFPMYFLSGVFFPLDYLPTPLFVVALTFPLTHAVMALKALLSGQVESIFFINLAMMFIYTFVFINVSLSKMNNKLQKVFNI